MPTHRADSKLTDKDWEEVKKIVQSRLWHHEWRLVEVHASDEHLADTPGDFTGSDGKERYVRVLVHIGFTPFPSEDLGHALLSAHDQKEAEEAASMKIWNDEWIGEELDEPSATHATQGHMLARDGYPRFIHVSVEVISHTIPKVLI